MQNALHLAPAVTEKSMPDSDRNKKIGPEDGVRHAHGAESRGDDEIRRLTSEVTKLRELLEHLRLQQYVQALLNTRRIMWMSLLSGVMSGLGAVLGATLILAILLYILGRLEVVPYIGHFVSEIIKVVKKSP